MFLYGKRSIIERLKIRPESIRGLYIEEGRTWPEIVYLARENHLKIHNLPSSRFLKLAKNMHAQGVIAQVDDFHYADFSQILNDANQNKPTLIFLDRITDPQNLGAIIRSCACFGNFALVLPRHESAEITESVLRVACGAENYLQISIVTNLTAATKEAKAAGYWVAAAVAKEGGDLRLRQLPFPLAVIFGSEAKGIRPGLMKYIDDKLTLSMDGAKLSFNVATAVSIFCYEISRQKNDAQKSQS